MDNQLEIQLNFRNKVPISEQLQGEMHRFIAAGILKPGEQLPTVRSLAAQLRVNFNTVARVYRALDQEGLISTQQGRGSYVLEDAGASQPAPSQIREEKIEQLIVDLLEKASRFQISPKELRAALSKHIEQSRKITGLSRRKKFIAQKKRLVTPAWVREIRKTNIAPSSTKYRRRPKHKF